MAMTDSNQAIRDDLAFLRSLADEGGSGLARTGAALITVGLIFGVICAVYWAVFSGRLPMADALSTWLWAGGVVLMLAIMSMANRRLPAPRGAGSRALAAAWGGTGVSLTVTGAALGLGGWRTGNPHLVLEVFPVLLFAFYGAAWSVAFAARRRAWCALVAAGCMAASIGEGALMGAPEQWLLLSAGLFGLVAAPGFAILRLSRAA
jgi:hypothetical protein